MQLDEAMQLLRKHEAALKQMGVKRLYVFGSTARGEQRPDSDVDLFFDHEKGALDVFDYMRIKQAATAILGRPADIMTRTGIHRRVRPVAEAEAVAVF